MRDDVRVSSSTNQEILQAELHFKFGADGASAQARYKLGFDSVPDGAEPLQESESDNDEEDQEDQEPSNFPSDAHVFTATMVPLGLRVGNTWVYFLLFLPFHPLHFFLFHFLLLHFILFRCVLASLKEGVSVCPSVTHKLDFLEI